jgi:hypothetical protein
MVTDIKNWSTTASNNTSLSGVSAAEGMAPSLVNDLIRGVASDVREWYEDASWIDFGDTPTRTGDTTFTVAGDLTARYHANRRLKATDSSTIYATVASSSYSSPNTTVTVTADSGTLSASLSAVAVGPPATNDAQPRGIFEVTDADILRADTADELTVGYSGATTDAGTKSSGTFTPSPDSSGGGMLHFVNGGAHTLGVPTKNCTMVLLMKNNASAGTLTTSSFTKVDGDDLTTTDGHEFFLYLTRYSDGSTTFSALTVKALQ